MSGWDWLVAYLAVGVVAAFYEARRASRSVGAMDAISALGMRLGTHAILTGLVWPLFALVIGLNAAGRALERSARVDGGAS